MQIRVFVVETSEGFEVIVRSFAAPGVPQERCVGRFGSRAEAQACRIGFRQGFQAAQGEF